MRSVRRARVERRRYTGCAQADFSGRVRCAAFEPFFLVFSFFFLRCVRVYIYVCDFLKLVPSCSYVGFPLRLLLLFAEILCVSTERWWVALRGS